MGGAVIVNQPGVYLVDADGNVVTAADGTTITAHEGLLVCGKDGSVMRFMRVAADGTLRVDPTGVTTQPISVATLPLPAGAATETTLASVDAKTPALGQAAMAASVPTTIASDQSAVASKNAAASQVDGHSASIGATTDADSANTLIGRTKQLVTLITARLPAALVGGRLDSNVGAWMGSTVPTVGSKTSANSVPTVIASDQVAVASKNAAATQVDGHSATIGTTTDADTTDTVIGRLKQLVVRLPSALVGGRLDVNLGTWFGSTAPTVGQKAMAAGIPVVVASDQSEVASKNAAASQVDGHSVSIGASTDADTANTLIGRTKQIITMLAGGLPAALTGSGNLKVAQQEAMPAGTNRLGSVRLVDANDLALDLARNTTIPANSRGLLVVGDDEDGKAQALEVNIDALDGKRRLQIEGHVSIAAPAPPVNTTAVSFTFSGALAITSTQTDNYVITNAKRFVLQQIVAGSEGDSTAKGSVIEVFYFDGTTEHLVEREYVNGFTTQISPLTEISRDGTQTMDGNGTTKTVRVKRRRLSGSSQEVDFVIRGYEYTP